MTIHYWRLIYCTLLAAICTLPPGCDTATNTPSPSPQATTDPLAAASQRIEFAEARVAATNEAINQFLNENQHILDSWNPHSPEAAIRIQSSIIEYAQLQKTRNALAAQHKQLIEQKKSGDFDPADEEQAAIESSPEIIDLDTTILSLRVDLDTLVNGEDEHLAHSRIKLQEILTAKQSQRDKLYQQMVQVLLNAKIEQAQAGIHILDRELAETRPSIAKWTEQHDRFLEIKAEYDALVANLRSAERERDTAIKALTAIIDQNE